MEYTTDCLLDFFLLLALGLCIQKYSGFWTWLGFLYILYVTGNRSEIEEKI